MKKSSTTRSVKRPAETSPTASKHKAHHSQKSAHLSSQVTKKTQSGATGGSDEDGVTGGTEKQDEDSCADDKGKKKLQQITSAEAGGLGRVIDEEPFYHGFMTPAECKPLLLHLGDFLVRKTEFSKKMVFAISVCIAPGTDAPVKHFIIKRTRAKQLYYVYGYAFKTISDLIAYHSRYKKPISKGGECITKAVGKSVWQLYHEQIEKTKKLGEGAFGEVFAGVLSRGVFSARIEVAVKQLHEDSICMDERIKFLREANVMLKLSHKNIIKLYGVAAAKDPIMIVMELAPGGTLLARVQDKEKRPTSSDLVRYSSGAAAGMAYLESQDIIHRDIAARNCLLGKDDEAKISDFGLSLISATYREKALKNVPIRWLAPETLKHGTYSGKSDMWSFGVMMWEVFSFGGLPYGDIDDFKEIRRGVLKQSLKLSAPPGTPKDAEEVMYTCLNFDPDKRPTFAVLAVRLAEVRRVHCQPQTFASKIRNWIP